MFGIISRVISYLSLSSSLACLSGRCRSAASCGIRGNGGQDGRVCRVILADSPCVRSLAAFLFPIFASYKALKANDQTQLTPWLMYWIVIACVITVENFLGWFLNLYVPLTEID